MMRKNMTLLAIAASLASASYHTPVHGLEDKASFCKEAPVSHLQKSSFDAAEVKEKKKIKTIISLAEDMRAYNDNFYPRLYWSLGFLGASTFGGMLLGACLSKDEKIVGAVVMGTVVSALAAVPVLFFNMINSAWSFSGIEQSAQKIRSKAEVVAASLADRTDGRGVKLRTNLEKIAEIAVRKEGVHRASTHTKQVPIFGINFSHTSGGEVTQYHMNVPERVNQIIKIAKDLLKS
jgi:hypothetical protein